MNIQFPKILLALVLCGIFSRPAAAQQVENVVGAAFTATFSRTTPGQPKRTCRIARASNGSIYLGCSGANDRLSSVEISDVPNNRLISFFIPPSDTPDHTYRLSTPRDGKFKTVAAEDIRAQLHHAQGICSCDGQPSSSLGEKSNDGLTLFGFRTEQTYKDGSKRITEYWESDLGVVVSRKDMGPQAGEEHSYVVTNIRREEPDPSLFEIPKEYISDPLLEARTIYIENLTGVPEVIEGAMVGLDLWKKGPGAAEGKPLTFVNEKNAADLIVTFTRVPVVDTSSKVESSNEGAGKPGIRMAVVPRDSSEPAYDVTVALEHNSVFGCREVAMQCISRLRNRLASTRVGLRPQPGSTTKAQAAQ
jgi:hypothetical protein